MPPTYLHRENNCPLFIVKNAFPEPLLVLCPLPATARLTARPNSSTLWLFGSSFSSPLLFSCFYYRSRLAKSPSHAPHLHTRRPGGEEVCLPPHLLQSCENSISDEAKRLVVSLRGATRTLCRFVPDRRRTAPSHLPQATKDAVRMKA